MTDNDIVQLARRINQYQQKIIDIMDEIRDSDHSYAELIVRRLEDNLFGHGASAVHCVSHFLEHPERWELTTFDIRYMGRVKPDGQ